MLSLIDVGLRRGHRWLVRGLALQVLGGQTWQIEGANGAGKTTLLRALAGLFPLGQGQILWRGRALVGDGWQAVHQEMAWMGHTPAQKANLDAPTNLTMACALAGQTVATSSVQAALEGCGLGRLARRPVGQWSQGQRRLAALARLALPGAPALWLLDEPFVALDEKACQWLQQLMQRHVQGGGAVVFTAHGHVGEAYHGLRRLAL